jgi:hypothetical protein
VAAANTNRSEGAHLISPLSASSRQITIRRSMCSRRANQSRMTSAFRESGMDGRTHSCLPVPSQHSDYPPHITALLEIDLQRIAIECGILKPEFDYSLSGPILTIFRVFSRSFSARLLR